MFIFKFRAPVNFGFRVLQSHLRFKSSVDLVPAELPAASKPSETFWQGINKDKTVFWLMTSAATGALAWLKSDINRLDQNINKMDEKVERGLGAIRTEMAQERSAIRAEMAQDRAQINYRLDQIVLLFAGQQEKKEAEKLKQAEKDESWCR